MKNLLLSLAFFLVGIGLYGQEIINLETEPQSEFSWEGGEYNKFEADWKTQVVTNVSAPSMEVFLPDPEIANGTSVIIAPGGGLFALAIEKEGNAVARWLNAKGITAFVLKYRLYPVSENGIKEIMALGEKIPETMAPILPLAVADGLQAVKHVRENAASWNLDPGKIGFLGFSAGGAVTVGLALYGELNELPNFLVPIYPWMTVIGEYELPEEYPPALIICASDDELLLAPDSINLYSKWIDGGGTAEMHMYAKGGHGFGMDPQGLPADTWISRFYEWALSEGLTASKNPG